MDLSEDEILLAELFNAQYISRDSAEDTDDQICFWAELPKKCGDYFFPQRSNDGSLMGSVITENFFKEIESGSCYGIDFDNKEIFRVY